MEQTQKSGLMPPKRREVEPMKEAVERRTYVCKRPRMCSYLVERGFSPYKISPDRANPRYNVYLFTATPELHSAVMDYVISRQGNNLMKESNKDGRSKERV